MFCALFGFSGASTNKSMSVDSIDSEYVGERQKSILKKSESSRSTYYTGELDDDTEKLILDNASPNMNTIRIRQTPFFSNQMLGAFLRSNNNEQVNPNDGKRRLSKSIGDYRNTEVLFEGTDENKKKQTRDKKQARKLAKRILANERKRSSGTSDDGSVDSAATCIPKDPHRRIS